LHNGRNRVEDICVVTKYRTEIIYQGSGWSSMVGNCRPWWGTTKGRGVCFTGSIVPDLMGARGLSCLESAQACYCTVLAICDPRILYLCTNMEYITLLHHETSSCINLERRYNYRTVKVMELTPCNVSARSRPKIIRKQPKQVWCIVSTTNSDLPVGKDNYKPTISKY
jgi:hypothetical protein